MPPHAFGAAGSATAVDSVRGLLRMFAAFFGALLFFLLVRDGHLRVLRDRLVVARATAVALVAQPGAAGTAASAELDEDFDGLDGNASDGQQLGVGTGAPAGARGMVNGPTANGPITASGAAPRRGGGGVRGFSNPCVKGPADACQTFALDAWLAAARRAAGHTLGRALRVSFYGDSVVASDALPAELRKRAWARWGNGGPGFVYAAPPHRFCGHEAISRTTTGTWSTSAVSTISNRDAWYGPGNAAADTSDGTATIDVKDGTFDYAAVFFQKWPQAGGLTIAVGDAQPAALASASAQREAVMAEIAVPTPAKRLRLVAQGKNRVFGVVMENHTGAVVDNLGVVSVNAKNFATNSAAHFASQVAARGADLQIVLIGANEAQWLGAGDKDAQQYEARFAAALAPLRAGAPGASCLVVAPTDQAQVDGGETISRPVVPVLVAAQKRAAEAAGCAFFNTYEWMGGKGSAVVWLQKGLIGSDFMHLTRKGASRLASALFAVLSEGR